MERARHAGASCRRLGGLLLLLLQALLQPLLLDVPLLQPHLLKDAVRVRVMTSTPTPLPPHCHLHTNARRAATLCVMCSSPCAASSAAPPVQKRATSLRFASISALPRASAPAPAPDITAPSVPRATHLHRG
jgi:hypothetical protein